MRKNKRCVVGLCTGKGLEIGILGLCVIGKKGIGLLFKGFTGV